MKVAIIGGGFGLNVQAPIITLQPELSLIAVSTMKRHQLPKSFDQKEFSYPIHYRDWRHMIISEEVELLFISTLPVHHFEIIEFALANGIKNIVCEKPFTMTSKESEELLKLSKYYQAKILIDFEWRYHPLRKKFKDMFDDNHIGTPLHFEYHISSAQYEHLLMYKRGWMGSKEQYGGILGAIGTHMLDCLRWMLKDEVQDVQGTLHTHVPFAAGEIRDADDAFFLHGKMKNNTTFSIQVLTGIQHRTSSNLSLFGTEGTLHLKNDNDLSMANAGESFQSISIEKIIEPPKCLAPEPAAYFTAFYPYLESVYRYTSQNIDDEHLPKIQDGHENQKLIDRIRNVNP